MQNVSVGQYKECPKCFRKTVQKSVKCLHASKLLLRLLKLTSGVKANYPQRVRCSVNWESIQQNVKQNAKCCDLVLDFAVTDSSFVFKIVLVSEYKLPWLKEVHSLLDSSGVFHFI